MRATFPKALQALCALIAASLCAISSAHAADEETDQLILSTTRGYTLEGPREDEHRAVFVWRPANIEGPLPVVYAADGMPGMAMTLRELYPAIADGRAPPIMVVAIAAHRTRRHEEYAEEGRDYVRHRDWLIEGVIPWAEATQGAARERERRIISGFSNGADFAIAMARERPALFGAVLAHSPMTYPNGPWVQPTAATQRWAVSGGTIEDGGRMALHLESILERQGAARWFCRGAWRHDRTVMTTLTPGAVMWLFGFEEAAAAVSTEREREDCSVRPGER